MRWEPRRVLHRWFGPLDADGLATAEKQRHWWTKDPDFDATLKRDFGDWVRAALRGRLEHDGSTDAQLAQIVLLDQFTRNIYRDQVEMYSGDAAALELCHSLIQSPAMLELPLSHGFFAHMPLMHSEEISDQEHCVTAMERLLARSGQNARGLAGAFVKFAISHRDIVARFGRFPHRNAILGRSSSKEELTFLKRPGSSF